jgi:hypothetical protein
MFEVLIVVIEQRICCALPHLPSSLLRYLGLLFLLVGRSDRRLIAGHG